MRVIANQRGYFGTSLREPNEEFDVPDGTTASWFTSLEVPDEESATETQLTAPGPRRKGR